MIENSSFKDFSPIFAGVEQCEKSHSFGPRTRDYYLIHFCLKGSGVLHDKLGNHKISAGELFIIRPNEITTYVADEKSPWEYAWIAFTGEQAYLFNTQKSVYDYSNDTGNLIKKLVNKKQTSPTAFIPLLFGLLYELFSEKHESVLLHEKIKKYIQFNYSEDLTVKNISDFFGFERSYLFRIFKKNTGISIKEYITIIRMEQAKKLLEKGYPVNSTAFAVGYKDEFNFSKAFKKRFGFSPKIIKLKLE